MEKAYQDLDIQFLPDDIISELNQEKLTALVSSSFMDLDSSFNYMGSLELLSHNNLMDTGLFVTQFNSLTEYLTTVLVHSF